MGLYFLGGSVVAHFRIRKYRANKLKETKSGAVLKYLSYREPEKRFFSSLL